MRKLKALASTVATAAIIVAAGQACAQSQSAPAAPAAPQQAPADSGALQDIVVTARRQSESILKVPVAAVALSTTDLANKKISDISSLSGQVPSLQIANTGGGIGSYTIRGIGSSTIDGGAEQSVVTVIDGVQTTRGQFISLGLLDLQEVEVLKGPQVLFFGKNSPAGVVSLDAKGPTDKLEADLKAGYEFGAKEKYVEGAVSGPLTDTLSVRAAVRYDDLSGWLHDYSAAVPNPNPFGNLPANAPPIGAANYSNFDKNLVGRVTVKYQPTSDFTVTLRALGSTDRNTGPQQYADTLCPGSAHPDNLGVPETQNTCTITNVTAIGATPQTLLNSNPQFQAQPYGRFKSYLTSLTMAYKAGPVDLTSVTAFMGYNAVLQQSNPGTYGYPFYTPDFNFHQFSQEVRGVTHLDSAVNFSGGLYYESSSYGEFGPNAVYPAAVDPATGKSEDYDYVSYTTSRTYSAFAQIRWKIVDQFELDGGARYSHDERTNLLYNGYVNPNSFLGAYLLAQGDTHNNGKASFNNLSPEITATWTPMRDTLFYGSYRTGYKAGAATSPGLIAPGDTVLFYQPEKIYGFEIGAKTLQLNGRLRLTASAFTYKYSNLQISNFDAATISVQPLAGNLQIKGVEADATYKLTKELLFNAAFGYVDSRYTNFQNVACSPSPLFTACDAATGGTVDLTGMPRYRSPKWTGNAGFTYETPVSQALIFALDGSMSFSSSYYTQENDAPYALQTAYQLFNAGIRLKSADNRWQIAVIGRNLGSKQYIQSSYDLANSKVTPGAIDATISRPRQVAIELKFHY